MVDDALLADVGKGLLLSPKAVCYSSYLTRPTAVSNFQVPNFGSRSELLLRTGPHSIPGPTKPPGHAGVAELIVHLGKNSMESRLGLSIPLAKVPRWISIFRVSLDQPSQCYQIQLMLYLYGVPGSMCLGL